MLFFNLTKVNPVEYILWLFDKVKISFCCLNCTLDSIQPSVLGVIGQDFVCLPSTKTTSLQLWHTSQL